MRKLRSGVRWLLCAAVTLVTGASLAAPSPTPVSAPALAPGPQQAPAAPPSTKAKPMVAAKNSKPSPINPLTTTKPTTPPPLPRSVRSILYSEAYKRRNDIGPHIAIKITPPGRRGKPGFVLAEAYNYTNTNLHAVDLHIVMETAEGEELNGNISANDVRPNLSGITQLRLPDRDKVVRVTSAKVAKMAIVDDKGKRVAINYYIDIIH